jgi:hypothetical protein
MTNALLSREDYKHLYEADLDSGRLADVLNRNGKCNWTVCPACKLDDFHHSSNCDIRKEVLGLK